MAEISIADLQRKRMIAQVCGDSRVEIIDEALRLRAELDARDAAIERLKETLAQREHDVRSHTAENRDIATALSEMVASFRGHDRNADQKRAIRKAENLLGVNGHE